MSCHADGFRHTEDAPAWLNSVRAEDTCMQIKWWMVESTVCSSPSRGNDLKQKTQSFSYDQWPGVSERLLAASLHQLFPEHIWLSLHDYGAESVPASSIWSFCLELQLWAARVHRVPLSLNTWYHSDWAHSLITGVGWAPSEHQLNRHRRWGRCRRKSCGPVTCPGLGRGLRCTSWPKTHLCVFQRRQTMTAWSHWMLHTWTLNSNSSQTQPDLYPLG